jgi:hypothetical protein
MLTHGYKYQGFVGSLSHWITQVKLSTWSSLSDQELFRWVSICELKNNIMFVASVQYIIDQYFNLVNFVRRNCLNIQECKG